VLSGGEAAAVVFIDAVARLLPGVLGDEASALNDSFEDGLLDAPYFTRPEEVNGLTVPEVLRSGNHERIAQWRQGEREGRTQERRPDLWDKYRQRDKHKSQ
jgi:tRNA (guanine37-N1)-methyltransferase